LGGEVRFALSFSCQLVLAFLKRPVRIRTLCM
jgi:hypothetical protein